MVVAQMCCRKSKSRYDKKLTVSVNLLQMYIASVVNLFIELTPNPLICGNLGVNVPGVRRHARIGKSCVMCEVEYCCMMSTDVSRDASY